MMTAGEADLSPNVKCVIEDCGYSSVWDEFAGQLEEMFGLPTFPVLDAASLVTLSQLKFSQFMYLSKNASTVAQYSSGSSLAASPWPAPGTDSRSFSGLAQASYTTSSIQ